MAANVETTNGSTFKLQADLTGVAPTAATEGQAVKDLAGITVIVETSTPASQTLSGAGSLLCYLYDGATGGPAAWSRCPALDLPVTLSGVARMAFPAMPVDAPRNARVLWLPSGVTTSAGTRCTVYQLGHTGGLPKNKNVVGVY